MTLPPIDILYRDKKLVAINKPHGLPVHASSMVRDANFFALQLLRDQIGQKVYPVHRIDRKTSGILLFALDSDTQRMINLSFAERKIDKTYLAIVRGFFPNTISVDYPLTNEKGKSKEAITHFRLLQKSEIPLANERYPTSRYSLIEAKPITGRTHQIRRHLNHLRHPIIGDRPHGCNKQNRLLLTNFGMREMMLHASRLVIPDHNIDIKAKTSSAFEKMKMNLSL